MRCVKSESGAWKSASNERSSGGGGGGVAVFWTRAGSRADPWAIWRSVSAGKMKCWSLGNGLGVCASSGKTPRAN